MNYEALIIVDMQTALVEASPYNIETVVANIKALDTCLQKTKNTCSLYSA